jgi:hypothetical protein
MNDDRGEDSAQLLVSRRLLVSYGNLRGCCDSAVDCN